jgi:hypothetical protein
MVGHFWRNPNSVVLYFQPDRLRRSLQDKVNLSFTLIASIELINRLRMAIFIFSRSPNRVKSSPDFLKVIAIRPSRVLR